MKKRSLLVLSLALFALCGFLLAGCGQSVKTGPQKVAILFPNSSDSWRRNAVALHDAMVKDEVITDVRFADTAEEQMNQLRKVIESETDAIIIGAVDADALHDALDAAQKKKLPVIAYDRLITNSGAVSYYVAYDGKEIGRAQGRAIEKALRLREFADTANLELFAGDHRDNNARLFFEGAMEILQPYIDSGRLMVPSGQKAFVETTTADWARAAAWARMARILKNQYADGLPLHAVLAPNDNLAGGIREALEDDYTGEWPFITGLDADPEAVRAIAAGRQGVTVDKPPAPLVKKCRALLRELKNGAVNTKDAVRVNNGVIDVPSFLCLPVLIDRHNIESVSTMQ